MARAAKNFHGVREILTLLARVAGHGHLVLLDCEFAPLYGPDEGLVRVEFGPRKWRVTDEV